MLLFRNPEPGDQPAKVLNFLRKRIADGAGLPGHVGIVAGVSGSKVNLLGGNQSNAINIRSFPRAKFIAFRWPKTFPV